MGCLVAKMLGGARGGRKVVKVMCVVCGVGDL